MKSIARKAPKRKRNNQPKRAGIKNVPLCDAAANDNKPPAAKSEPSARDWTTLLKHVKRGKKRVIARTAANVAVILRYHPRWVGVLAYDEFEEAIVTLQPPPWHPADTPKKVAPGVWTDGDTDRAVNWLSREVDLEVTQRIVEQALTVVADTNKVHPVRDYLRSLKWDRKKRLDKFIGKYLGGEVTHYTTAVGKMWMISGVARAMQPGCQADYALILESQQQGRNKSAAFRALVRQPEWYSETPINIGDKDSYQNLRGVWIYGLDELDSVRRAEHTRTKTFLTATRDRYRPSYGRRPRTFPRQNVFCGSTNEEQYFSDAQNRRYWPVRVVRRADVAAIERDRDQLWAEACHRYGKGEHWWPNAEIEKLCAAEQAERMLPDDWQPPVAKWLKQHDDGNGVLTADVLTGALDFTWERIKKSDTMRVAEVLRSLGYQRGPRERQGGRQERRYLLADPKARAAQVKAFKTRAMAKGRRSTQAL